MVFAVRRLQSEGMNKQPASPSAPLQTSWIVGVTPKCKIKVITTLQAVLLALF